MHQLRQQKHAVDKIKALHQASTELMNLYGDASLHKDIKRTSRMPTITSEKKHNN